MWIRIQLNLKLSLFPRKMKKLTQLDGVCLGSIYIDNGLDSASIDKNPHRRSWDIPNRAAAIQFLSRNRTSLSSNVIGCEWAMEYIRIRWGLRLISMAFSSQLHPLISDVHTCPGRDHTCSCLKANHELRFPYAGLCPHNILVESECGRDF